MNRWEASRPRPWADTDRFYVKGYILALEDVLKDMDQLEEVGEFRTMVDAQALDLKIQESLASARRTLEQMQ